MTWTTSEDLRAQVRKLWDRGRLLACLIDPGDVFPLRLILKTPTSTELSERFDDVRKWTHELQAHTRSPQRAGYRLVMREVRHRIIGLNSIPDEAWVDSLEEAVRFIGERQQFERFEDICEATRSRFPVLISWLAAHPLRALELEGVWPQLLQFISWLKANPRPGIYLRQVDLPQIHSKFIETHRPVLAELLDLALDAGAIDQSAAGLVNFARRYGFLTKPTRIRLRGLPPYEDDLTLTAEAFATLNAEPSHIFITENEINFLTFPAPPASLVLFGSGYGFEKLAAAKWLRSKTLYYWGDIDTHGFAILEQLRSYLPHVKSLMMDRETLLAHREQWGRENSPISRSLSRLTDTETAVYNSLRDNTYAHHLRLEQERIAFTHVTQIVAALPTSCA